MTRPKSQAGSLRLACAMALALALGACGGRGATAPASGDVAVPWPIDDGASATGGRTPSSYKGLPLSLVDRPAPPVTAVDGVIGVVCIGMSNANQECARLIAATDAGGPWGQERNAQVRIVNCAVGGHAIERWIDSAYDATLWRACIDARLPARGVRQDQIRVILHKAANQFGIGPGGTTLPLYPDPGSNFIDLLAHLDAFAARVPTFFPAVQAVYVSSRSYGGFTTRPERGDPQAYEEGHAVNRWLADHATVGGIWYGWGAYLWAPDCSTGRTNGGGVCYVREDYVADAVHPSSSGEIKMARLQHERFGRDAWYRP